LIGNPDKIRAKAKALGLENVLDKAEFVSAADETEAAAAAAKLAGEGKVDVLMKGHLRTDQLLKAVLDKQHGLRTGRLLNDILLYEDVLSGERRLVGITDGGLNVAPNLDQKKQIVANSVEALWRLGFKRPKVAIMSATEVVSEGLPSTMDAKALTETGAAGEFGEAEVYGPLALDNALLESAAKAKGITNPVAGHADCMIVHCIEAGNHLGKATKYLGNSNCAHVIVGARVPVLIPSRVESADDKLNSIALGVLFAER
jgi:phosphate butyryltransferase